MRQQPDVIEENPEMSMWDLIVKNKMPPTRIARYCCKTLKEHGGTGRLVVTGVRAAESAKRSKRRQMETCYADGTKTFLHLIFDWSNEDVWEYIKSNQIPYCCLYDEGWSRIGCLMCPMSGPKKQNFEAYKYPKYKDLYIKAFDKMLSNLEISPYSWKTGQDVWDWWTIERAEKSCEGQTFIFDSEGE